MLGVGKQCTIAHLETCPNVLILCQAADYDCNKHCNMQPVQDVSNMDQQAAYASHDDMSTLNVCCHNC